MKKILIITMLLLFTNNIFAWNSLTFTKYHPTIVACIANNNKDKKKDKKEEQKQRMQQYQDALEKKLRKGFDGPDVTNIRRCYINKPIYSGINIVTIDNHDYITYTNDYGSSIIHSESCPCKRMEEIK